MVENHDGRQMENRLSSPTAFENLCGFCEWRNARQLMPEDNPDVAGAATWSPD
jgi:hypothetical protein